ncbi:MAG: aspartate aminotransferase family protein [Vulcanimicrobiota bacterium]
MTSEQLVARRERAVAAGVGRLNPVTVASARGAVLTDVEGHQFIDLASGIGVVNSGHCHPRVVAAIVEQSHRLLHTCFHVATYEPYVALCEKLIELFPHGSETRAMLVNSGAEAVENAVKIARQATGRPAIIAFSEGFHGRTLLSTTLTSKVAYKLGCGPYAPEIYRLPYPNRFRYGDGLGEADFVARELARFRHALSNQVSAEQVAAVIIEPVQGEGGFNLAPFAYLQGLREICSEFGILLVVDEVQSGFCRTGRWAAYQHAGIVPDLSTWAKAMGGGLPIAAVVGRAEVMNAARPGTLGGTYGGNPVACAAALANIEVMEQEQLGARAEALGHTIRARFQALQANSPYVVDVRGLGAMMALELEQSGLPATELAQRVVAGCREQGVLVILAGTYGNVLRILAPLVIEESQLERALDVIVAQVESLHTR